MPFNPQAFMESVCGRDEAADWKPGTQVQHPDHGLVTIIGGQYWGTHGLSNFWYWTDAAGEEHHGYGWR